MAAPRSTSLRALRSLAQQQHLHSTPASAASLSSRTTTTTTTTTTAPCRRSLHITGSNSAQPVAGADVISVYQSRSLSDLRTECERRRLGAGGSKAELVDRLANHDHLQTRAFSIAMRRIDGQAFGASSARHFNTSRASKSRNDSSPVDLVYMPRSVDANAPTDPAPRVPILPDAYTHYESPVSAPANLKPLIHTVADLGGDLHAPSAMTEVVDNQALDINPFNLTEAAAQSRYAAESSDATQGAGETVGAAVKEAWRGFWQDVLGSSDQNATTTSKRG